jgi:hypothetical protein
LVVVAVLFCFSQIKKVPMPPKAAKDGKDKKPKVNMAMEMHVDLDLKRLYDSSQRVKANMDPANAFLKKIKNELQLIKDGEQMELPSIPLFLTEPMPEYATSKALFGILEAYPWLRQIQLYHCKIGDDGAMVIADFLKVYKPSADRNPFGIEILELPECEIGPAGAQCLGKALTQNETVKILNLDFNRLGDEGAANLGDGLKWNSTLEKVTMKYNEIGPIGGECIAKFIIRSSSVKELSLKGNPLGPQGVTHIAKALAKNAYLTKLDLADTGFGIDLEAIEALRDGLDSNDSLEGVDINLNSLVPAGLQLLIDMLKTKPKLCEFQIYERISETIFKDAMDTIQNNIKLMKKKKKKGGGGGGKKKKDK